MLTWNLLGAANPNLHLVAEVIESYHPDAVALQEVRRHQAHHLSHRLGWRHAWTRKHYAYTPLLWRRAEGVAILSPHVLGQVTRGSISPGESTWTYRHRVVLAADVARGPDVLRVYDTHLASHSADDRIAQARRIAHRIASEAQGRVVVVAGDLNADVAVEPEVIREFHAVGLRDHGGEHTNPSIAPAQRLDYVLLPEGAEHVDTSTPGGGQAWHGLSDHLPVLVEFRCAPSSGATPSR